MVPVGVRYLFISQWMKRSNHGLLVFPPKKTLIWRRHCLIGQSCCSMTSERSISWFLESSWAPSVRLTNQKPRAFVSVQQTNPIALFPFVCCFCFVRAFSVQGHTKIALTKCRRLGKVTRALLLVPVKYSWALELTQPVFSWLVLSLLSSFRLWRDVYSSRYSSYCRSVRTVTWLPKFLASIGYHLFLPMVLRCARKLRYNNNNIFLYILGRVCVD